MGDLKEFDDLDKRIIEMLCTSSQGSYRQLAKQLGVHPTTLIQRVKVLESKGVITGYRAKIDYVAMGYDYCGLVHIYSDDIAKVYPKLVDMPEVMAIYDVTGEADAIVMLAGVTRDDFSLAVKRINSIDHVLRTNTSIILGTMKSSSEFIPDFRSGEKD